MPRAFAEIAFTPSVVAAQERYGSRRANHGFTLAAEAGNRLGAAESAFIAERDSFYQATVSQDGWPYVQHRGGPPGFLRVLDPGTLAYADFRGNRQYLSVGNLNADDRLTLILVDYANQRRLKIWGRARLVHADQDAALLARLALPGYSARVERGVVIAVAAFDWNCPQHITPRYTLAEVEALASPLVEENRRLKARLADLAAPG